MGVVESFGQHFLGEEIVSDESAQALADLILALLDDGRVRNRETEWMAEQCRDREPVGDGSHHGRLCCCPHVTDPVVIGLLPAGDDEDDGGEDQERSGEPLHAPQIVPPLFVVVHREHVVGDQSLAKSRLACSAAFARTSAASTVVTTPLSSTLRPSITTSIGRTSVV